MKDLNPCLVENEDDAINPRNDIQEEYYFKIEFSYNSVSYADKMRNERFNDMFEKSHKKVRLSTYKYMVDNKLNFRKYYYERLTAIEAIAFKGCDYDYWHIEISQFLWNYIKINEIVVYV
jgi:hypothetical protein